MRDFVAVSWNKQKKPEASKGCSAMINVLFTPACDMSTLLCGKPLNVYVLLGFVPDSGWQWHTVRQHNFLFLWSTVLREIRQICF